MSLIALFLRSHMLTRLGNYTIIYGIILFLCGLFGYISNPTKAITALITGIAFGGIFSFLGFFLRRKKEWALDAILLLLICSLGVFIWRTYLNWFSVMTQGSDKLLAAILTSWMSIATIIYFILYYYIRKQFKSELK